MKEFEDLKLPGDRSYSEDHQWVKKHGKIFRVGISDFVQDLLGDILAVELPEVGDTFDVGDEFGTIESVDEVWNLFMPVGGAIVDVNENLDAEPDLLNDDPYGQWIIAVELDDPTELEALMTGGEYIEILRD